MTAPDRTIHHRRRRCTTTELAAARPSARGASARGRLTPGSQLVLQLSAC